MKGKILLATIIATLAIFAISSAAKVNAATPTVYGYTDKAQYMPGDKVTVTFFLYNNGPDQITLKNVTIVYPWYNLIWGGNQTINANDAAIPVGKNWNSTASFTIPTDSRVSSNDIRVDYYYTITVGSVTTLYHPTPGSIDFPLNVAPTISLNSMDNLVTLITVETVLIIVSALIIAAAVFLSAHRPKVTWTAEQKQ